MAVVKESKWTHGMLCWGVGNNPIKVQKTPDGWFACVDFERHHARVISGPWLQQIKAEEAVLDAFESIAQIKTEK